MTASGRVVAELGRPETPEETAARKARDSRLYRERKTLSNLIYALLVTLVAVAVMFFAAPHPSKQSDFSVDAQSLAAGATDQLGTTALVPAISSNTNAAELRTGSDGVTSWYVGFITTDGEYIGFSQAPKANDSWVANQMANTLATSAIDLDGLHWTIYNNRDAQTDVGNVKYGMVTQVTTANGLPQTIVLAGTAGDQQFVSAAAAVAQAVAASGAKASS